MARNTAPAHERGTIIKNWAGKAPVCILYPNSYFVGMSNLAVHILYRALNDLPDVVCERMFLEGDGTPASLESRRPLHAFDIIFVTLSFEMDYVHVARALSSASVNVLARDRKQGDPLIVGGGICAMANPEPVARMFDLFVLGDIEATLPSLMETFRGGRDRKRGDLVESLSAPDWVHNPAHLNVAYGRGGAPEAFEPPSYRVRIERYTGRHLGTSAIITDRTEFADMFLVEGTRGCPSRCPFCLTGAIGPFVYDRLPPVGDDVRDVGIIGGGVSYHPKLADLIRDLKARTKRVHLPSLRVDQVPIEVIELVRDEVRTLTFGVEAASERLRRFIGKPLTDQEIYERIESIMAIKSFHLKLYFMVGLPGEHAGEVERIVDMAKHIMHLMIRQGAKRGTVGSITIHASPFVPKAATPFQWLPMEEGRVLKDKLAALKRGLGKAPNTFFTHESVKYSFLQGAFARGDRRVLEVILRLSAEGNLARVQRESPLNLNFYVTRERTSDEMFPWDFITGQEEKARLRRQLDAALAQL